MKITLKITADQGLATNKVCYAIEGFEALSSENKAIKSILYDVQDKVEKLARKIKRPENTFKKTKTFNLTLKWHEAYALLGFINHKLPSTGHNHDLQQVHDQLHQKLT